MRGLLVDVLRADEEEVGEDPWFGVVAAKYVVM
jgi:hypothetical protein